MNNLISKQRICVTSVQKKHMFTFLFLSNKIIQLVKFNNKNTKHE